MKRPRKHQVLSINAQPYTAVIVLFLVSSGLCCAVRRAQALMIDRIVARVNDDVITLSELQEEGLPLFEHLRQSYTGQELKHQVHQAERRFLDQLILRRLQLQYASQIGLTASENDINAALKDVLTRNHLTQDHLVELLTREGLTLQDYKDRLREQIVLARLMNQAVRSRVSVDASEVEAYYQAHRDDFRQPDEVKVRQIFFRLDPEGDSSQLADVQARASQVLAEARNGGDFADLARRYSEDMTAEKGGDLGVIRQGEALPELEKAIFALHEGEVSDIIRTANGLHIVKVEHIFKGSVRPLSEVRAEVEHRVMQEKVEKRFKEWTDELRDKAFVEITLHDSD